MKSSSSVSVAGLTLREVSQVSIAACGLPAPGSPLRVPDLYKRYREGKTPLYQLLFERSQRVDTDDEWLVRYSRKTEVKFIGIWDTVGTLGVPFGNIPFISRKNYRFHRTRLSRMYKEGAQALALDEHRKAYDAVLWTNFIPENPKTGEIIQEKVAKELYPRFEQRWFIGAHSNVGGGYRRDLCAQVPLKWMQERAKAAGLTFSRSVELNGREHLEGEPVDSFKRMLRGVYQIVRGFRRYYRPVERPWVEKERGFVESVNETIDQTVFERWQKDKTYRPKNLSEWAARTKTDLNTVALGDYSSPNGGDSGGSRGGDRAGRSRESRTDRIPAPTHSE